MNPKWICILIIYLLKLSFVKLSTVWIRNNGYRDIVISLPTDIMENNRLSVIHSLQQLIEYSSRVLYVATKSRSTYKDIILHIPRSWTKDTWLVHRNETVWKDNGGRFSTNDPDIYITTTQHRNKPYTLQAEGCGGQGARIYLPLSFLMSDDLLKHKSIEFVHYWAQYRYGVFPEGGFHSDPQYPEFFGTPGSDEIHATSCTNMPLVYNASDSFGQTCLQRSNNYIGKINTENCDHVSLDLDGEKLESSLMYQQALPHVFHFCDGEYSLNRRNHNPAGPSKHNILCFEEAVWPIILRSADFINGNNQATRYKPDYPTFHYIQEDRTRVVIAIYISENMGHKDSYRLLQSAIRKFILYDLPPEAEIGLVFVAKDIRLVRNMTILTDEDSKTKFLETDPMPDEINPTENTRVTYAIEKSMELLQDLNGPHLMDGIIILVSTSAVIDNVGGLEESLQSSRIRLFPILITNRTEDFHSLHILASSTGGFVSHVPQEGTTEFMVHLFMVFSSVMSHSLPSRDTDSILMIKKLPIEETSNISFTVDKFAIRTLKMFLFGPNFSISNPALVYESTELKTPDDIKPILRKREEIPAWISAIEKAQGGKYIFETRRKEGATDDVVVMVSGKAEDEPISVKAWTDSKTGEINSKDPLKIFCEVKYGLRPVINATVVATVFNPVGREVAKIKLLDTGYGDPDITKNDGIYTRYFTNYESRGYYNIWINVVADDNEALVLYVSDSPCCGSFVPSETLEPIGRFVRLSNVISILLVEDPLADDIDILSPNRVLDLHIADIDKHQMFYTLAWTAAGDDYDQGSASSYELKLFSERTEAKMRFNERGLPLRYKKEIVEFTPPAEYGLPQKYIVQLPEYIRTGTYFFALKALDDSANAGKVSNIVQVFIQNERTNNTIICTDRKRSNNDGTAHFAISGLCTLMQLLCIILLCYNYM